MHPLLSNDPMASIEAAKQLISGETNIDHAELIKIASDRKTGEWSRIAAIYAMGFLADRSFAPILRFILSDTVNSNAVRSHAAEALGNIRDRDAIMLLRDILGSAPEPALRESCEYALGELEEAA